MGKTNDTDGRATASPHPEVRDRSHRVGAAVCRLPRSARRAACRLLPRSARRAARRHLPAYTLLTRTQPGEGRSLARGIPEVAHRSHRVGAVVSRLPRSARRAARRRLLVYTLRTRTQPGEGRSLARGNPEVAYRLLAVSSRGTRSRRGSSLSYSPWARTQPVRRTSITASPLCIRCTVNKSSSSNTKSSARPR